jgi:tetratricopeptide (TPR) repeat protein
MIARAASITPNDWRLYQLAGQIALRERRPDDAVAEFRRAARLAPGVEAAVQNPLANALYMTGQYAEAEHEASIAIAVQPSAPEHRLIRGKAKLELGNAMEARQDLALCVRAYRDLLERGKDVSGPLAEAENRLALAFIGEGRPLLALAALERLYADSPENAEAAVSAIEEWLLEEPGRAPAELWAFALDVMLDVGLADAVITFCDALPLAYREEVDRVFAPIRARALVLKGRSEEALELLSGMPEAAKSTPKYDLAVARTRAALGHTATARFEFRAVLENPDASPKDRRQAEDGLAALAR